MTKIMKQFFVLSGNQNLIDKTENDDFVAVFTAGETLIPVVANHYTVLANREITDDEWTDITVDPEDVENGYNPNDLVVGKDWTSVKSILVLMASELYSKLGINGIEGISEGGLSQTITSNYSRGILAMINSQKRLRFPRSFPESAFSPEPGPPKPGVKFLTVVI